MVINEITSAEEFLFFDENETGAATSVLVSRDIESFTSSTFN
jgi:hypothetical protein